MQQEIPKHVAIILDGNRRFAKKLMAKPWKGHAWGKEKVKKILDWTRELDIKELTLWAFSFENFNRPKKEFDYLMKLFREALEELKKDMRIEEDKIKIRFIGRLELFPKDVHESMLQIMEKTKEYTKYVVNFAMAYGGRAELVDAAKRIARKIEKGELKAEEVDFATFEKELYMTDKPDLIIRTGGERRTSGFLLWQGDYAEWIFLEKTWPEFEKEDLVQCIRDYQQRERRFGR